MIEILPHPKRGTMEIGSERILPVFGQIRAADGASDERPVITVDGTDGSEDRHGSVINPSGWDVAPYLRNPVVLWSHGMVAEYPAVGKTIALRNAGGKWEFDTELLVAQWRNMQNNLAAFLWEAYRDFGLGAVSVSFLPKKWTDREATTIPTFFAENVEYQRQELTEISFVNVPSNRNALAKALDRQRALGHGDEYARILGFAIPPITLASRAAADGCKCCAANADCGCESMDASGGCSCHADCQGCVDAGCGGLNANPASAKALTHAAFRTQVRAIITRCCGCDPYCGMVDSEPDEPVDPTVQAAEIALANNLAADCLQDLDTALAGWRIAESDDLRSLCKDRVGYAMAVYDWLDWWLEYTYGEELGATIPDINFTDVQQIAAAAPEAFTRAGAVFSSANLAKMRSLQDHLGQATQHCEDLIAAANKTQTDSTDSTVQDTAPSGGIRVIAGDSSKRELDGTTPFVVVAPTDAADGRAADRSTPNERPDLYRVLLQR